MNCIQTKFRQPRRHFLTRLQISICLFLSIVSGCTDKAGAPVKLDVAQQTLLSAMEAWKDGKEAEDLLAEKPSIVVQESEWVEGTKLLEYEIVSDDQATGPNLIATVKLKLSKSDGTVTSKTATYVVGTSPGLTVYRNPMK